MREEGHDILSVRELGWGGKADTVLLFEATAQHRVILTHDADFGTLAIAKGEPYLGIVFLRPGHIKPEFTLQTLRLLFDKSPELPEPFLLVAQRTGDQVKVRVRSRKAGEPDS